MEGEHHSTLISSPSVGEEISTTKGVVGQWRPHVQGPLSLVLRAARTTAHRHSDGDSNEHRCRLEPNKRRWRSTVGRSPTVAVA